MDEQKKQKIDEGLKLAKEIKHDTEKKIAQLVNEFENLTGLNIEGISFKGHPTTGKEVDLEIDIH